MNIVKILIAIDNSEAALHTANYGINLAKRLKAKTGICYITKPSSANIDVDLVPVGKENTLQVRHDLLLDEINITHPYVVIEEFDPISNPKKEIEHLITLWQPDLLIIGHQTHNVLIPLLKSGLEKQLLEHLKVPLLIVSNETIHIV